MPGGSPAAWETVKPILQSISAKVGEKGVPCCQWVGKEGAGHFVKTVHNGIEYGDMQLISEAYYIMKHALGLSAQEMHEVFAEWNKGELDSYLIEITSDILAKVDKETGQPLVELILDAAGQKVPVNGLLRLLLIWESLLLLLLRLYSPDACQRSKMSEWLLRKCLPVQK